MVSESRQPQQDDQPIDMEEFQKQSDAYQAKLQGPLVSKKEPVDVLFAEFANAQPVYVAKTQSLAETYANYRVMKGDGDCGWRAVAFRYFEILLNSGDLAWVEKEHQRVMGLCTLIEELGHDRSLYDIFYEATDFMFLGVIDSIKRGATEDDSLLLKQFNIDYNSSSIITYFRFVTSGHIRKNADNYAAFLPMEINNYCNVVLETIKTEIDEIGLQGLMDCVIKDSGVAVEILYLDQSPGETVTRHRFIEKEENAPVMILLYRPGHYDILYR